MLFEPGVGVATTERLRHNGAVDCAEYQRLVSKHLKAIAAWKRTFDSPEAWEKALEAERAVVEHC